MNRPETAIPFIVNHGLFIRIAWWLNSILASVLFVAGLITQINNGFWQVPDQQAMISVPLLVRVLTENRLLTGGGLYPFVLVAFYIQATAFVAIGLLLFWRKSGDVMGVLASWMLIAIGLGFAPTIVFLPLLEPAWHVPTSIFQIGLFGSAFLFLCLFPNGRFVPQSFRYAAAIWLGYILLWLSFPELNPHRASTVWPPLVFVAAVWLGVVTQLVRYRRTSGPDEKQQAKWVIVGFMAANFGLFGVALLIGVGTVKSAAFIAAAILSLGLASIFIPITIGVALLRYRLWDFDIILNRTLVYGGLTALLALVYFSSIVLLQGILGLAVGERSPLVLVLSTLLIATLFAPLRGRVQAFIDRRFYRRKYDAEKSLARFATAARDEVELERLTAELLYVIEETMQPRHGVVGTVGHVDVDVESGEITITPAEISQIQENAEQKATHYSAAARSTP